MTVATGKIMQEARDSVRLETLERVCAKRNDAVVHPETRKLVANFSAALLEKLAKAEKKYGYSDNWRTDEWEAECRAELMRHIQKGDPLDVAAYAAFLWHRGWSTSTATRHERVTSQPDTGEQS